MKTWKTVRCVVEQRVRGDLSEKDFVWSVQRALDLSFVDQDILRRHPGTSLAKREVKSYEKVQASQRRVVRRETVYE